MSLPHSVEAMLFNESKTLCLNGIKLIEWKMQNPDAAPTDMFEQIEDWNIGSLSNLLYFYSEQLENDLFGMAEAVINYCGGVVEDELHMPPAMVKTYTKKAITMMVNWKENEKVRKDIGLAGAIGYGVAKCGWEVDLAKRAKENCGADASYAEKVAKNYFNKFPVAQDWYAEVTKKEPMLPFITGMVCKKLDTFEKTGHI